jgi:Zn-dependent oligopeptidase
MFAMPAHDVRLEFAQRKAAMDAVQQVPLGIPIPDPTSASVREEAIRERAYELYERRGRQDGLQQEDWFQAEFELRAEILAQQEPWTAAESPV